MKKISIREIEKAVGGQILYGSPDRMVSEVTTDSREMGEHTLFIPIHGAVSDGHQFLQKAIENGAAACLADEREALEKFHETHPEEICALVLVKDTKLAIQDLARYVRGMSLIPAVGVTGSVGKTTTREMIACALSAERSVYRTGRNYNNWLGVPLTLLSMPEDVDMAVLELGMNVPGELGSIAALCNLDAAVITNIGVAHIEFYGSQDKITEEKLTVTKGFWQEASRHHILFLNGDDPFLMKYRDQAGFPSVLYGTGDQADYQAKNIRQEGASYLFDLYVKGEFRLTVTLNVLGVHNVLNAAAALAVADHYGISLEKAARALSEFTGFQGRLQRIEKDGVLYINDCYNASPASMKAGLKVVAELQNVTGRRIAVLGDMLELGEDSPRFHMEVGAFGAQLPLDQLVLLGNMGALIGKSFQEADRKEKKTKIFAFKTIEEVTAFLKKEVALGDAVYFKASHGMKLQEVLEALVR